MKKITFLMLASILSVSAFAAKLITCSDDAGSELTFATSSFSGQPMLSMTMPGKALSFRGSDQIAILQYRVESYQVDAGNWSPSIEYDNVQFKVLNKDNFEAEVSVSRSVGCNRDTQRFKMRCESKDVVF